MDDIKVEITEEIKEKKKLIYHCPLAKKKQRTVSEVESPSECKQYSEEEIFLYNIRRLRASLDNE